jgi:hypothetical protein
MLTHINFEIDEIEWVHYFHSQQLRLKTDEPILTEQVGIIKVNDGFVYYMDGIHVLTRPDNTVIDMIITDPYRMGITIINTDKVARTHKLLTKQLGHYLPRLYELVVTLLAKNAIQVYTYDNTIEDIKEQILIEHSI